MFLSPPSHFWFLEDGYEVDIATGEIIGEGTHGPFPPSAQVQRILDHRNAEADRQRTVLPDSEG